MNKIILSLIIFIVSICTCQAQRLYAGDAASAELKLCNANATAEAQRVWTVLCQLYGNRIISGVVANVDWNTIEAENVHGWTGRYPALNTFDYIHAYRCKDVDPDSDIDYRDISPVLDWWNKGGLVSCMWHWKMPTKDGKDMDYDPDKTNYTAKKVIDTSTAEYVKAVHDIDQIAEYLKLLQDANIPVIWRPLHEAAGNSWPIIGRIPWFWWGKGGADSFKSLWRMMYDRLTNYHHLNNLIWVWTSQVDDDDWYPGDGYVDIVGRDSYKCSASNAKSNFNDLSKLYPTKLITLSECGNEETAIFATKLAPMADLWGNGAHFSWFCPWYDYDFNNGKSSKHKYADDSWWKSTMSQSVVVTRDEMKKLLNDAVVTQISQRTSASADTRAYNLQGIRQTSARRSVVIRGGRKYVE